MNCWGFPTPFLEFGILDSLRQLPVCKRFKTTYLARVSDAMMTNGESITSSISCAQKYLEDPFRGVPFEDTGVSVVKLELLW
mmetsp:Transcript_28503/g.42282  ORF Transcript_28503/g.42282 Transcript_28503/m.42282 type:complete len:82 (+) Transcript_28503:24-269(+)